MLFVLGCTPSPDVWTRQWRADAPFHASVGELTDKNTARAVDLELVNTSTEPRWFAFEEGGFQLAASGVLPGPNLPEWPEETWEDGKWDAHRVAVSEQTNSTGSVRLVQWYSDAPPYINLVRVPGSGSIRLNAWDVSIDDEEGPLRFTVVIARTALVDGKAPLESWFGIPLESTDGARVDGDYGTEILGEAALAGRRFDTLKLDVEERWLARSDGGWRVDVLLCGVEPGCGASR